jgi:hypothetical protein
MEKTREQRIKRKWTRERERERDREREEGVENA